MNNNIFRVLAVVVTLSILGIGLDVFFSHQDNLQRYAEDVEEYLHRQERLAESVALDAKFIERQTGRVFVPADTFEQDINRLEGLAEEPLNLLVYYNDSLVYWTNTQAFPKPSMIEDYEESGVRSRLVSLKNGDYLLKFFQTSHISPAHIQIATLIPIRNRYAYNSEYLREDFVANPDIPEAVKLTDNPTEFPIRLRSGEVLTYLDSYKPFKDRGQQSILLSVFVLWFFAVLYFIHSISKQLARQHKVLFGIGFLVSGFALFGLTIKLLRPERRFEDMPIFDQTFNVEVIGTTLGYLLMGIIFMVWAILFWHHHSRIQEGTKEAAIRQIPATRKFLLTAQLYLSIFGGILLTSQIFRSLIIDSEVDFDFQNLLDLKFYTVLSVSAVIAILFALFLFSNRIMVLINTIDTPWQHRSAVLGLAAVVSLGIFALFEEVVPPLWLVGFGTVFIFGFHLHLYYNRRSVVDIISWLLFFSFFATVLLITYSNEKDRLLRVEYAEALADPADQLAEAELRPLMDKLLNDASISRLMTTPAEQIMGYTLDSLIGRQVSNENYLVNNYSFDAFGYRMSDSSNLVAGQGIAYESMRGLFDRATPIEGTEKLHLHLTANGRSNYYLHLEYPAEEAERTPGELFVRVSYQPGTTSPVYSELLLNIPYKRLYHLDRYQHAVYHNKERFSHSDDSYPTTLSDRHIPPAGESRLVRDELRNRSELIYHDRESGYIVYLGRPIYTLSERFSLFSYVFAFLIVISLAIGFLMWVLSRFTGLRIDGIIRSSLRNRIETNIISLIFVSFLFVAGTTWFYFKTSTHNYHEARLERKINSVLKSSEDRLKNLLDEESEQLDFARMAKPISYIHNMDVNIFDLNGDLISSSDNNIFEKGIVAPKMGAIAFQELSRRHHDRSIQDEYIGGLNYRAAYVPLYRYDSDPVAYMGLPYYSTLRRVDREVSDFMGTLLNVYVVLIFIAVICAVVVANGITRPINNIGERLKQLRLGAKNRRLEWKNDEDEIGKLIAVYNNMVDELDEKIEQLGQRKMDEAWREMAKQVAHEIKNPLTPMKLQMQYLLVKYQQDPDSIGPSLKRVAAVVVEQIDELTHIANEFSSFAKMPAAENAEFNLTELVSRVNDFFREERHNGIELRFAVPNEQFMVFADRRGIMRVLNNIIKNAIQAIPEERSGLVFTTMRQEGSNVFVEVKDNGIGIPEDKQHKVFVPNFTTKSSGTGLGLAISKKIIDSIGGSLYFHTEPGVGTTFVIKLPINRVLDPVEEGSYS